jgi:hypothetical protein
MDHDTLRSSISFAGKFSPNFNLKDIISTYEGFFKEKKPKNMPDFQGEKKNANCQIFVISSSR